MADTYLTRIPTLSEAELREYLDSHGKYRLEAIEAAAAELGRRGRPVPEATLEEIRARVQARDAAKAGGPRVFRQGFLRDAQGPRLPRIRLAAGAILAAGLVTAGVIFRLAATATATTSPYDQDPQDSKSYLRQVEMIGGSANLVASQLRGWLSGLWHGTNLAFTVFGLSVLVAGVFWVVATRKGAGV